jgi:two-component system, LytTR family, sensor kinase
MKPLLNNPHARRSQRSKLFLQHLSFWVVYILLMSAKDLIYHPVYWELLISNSYTDLLYLPFVYFNLFYLVPKFLLPKKYFAYTLILVPLLALFTFLSAYNHYYSFYHFFGASLESAQFFITIEGVGVIFTEILLLVGTTTALHLFNEWSQKERYVRELEKKNLEVELMLLKNQLQPHFLFNALNSIYVMMERDVPQSREMLLQLSDLLSHQLYDSKKEQIALTKEVEHLHNFIQIESVRHGDLANIEVDMNAPEGYALAPMLLMPIVENAFKHGKSSKGYAIQIKLWVEHDKMHFQVENSVNNLNGSKPPGIGLSNLKRRLELLYPKEHELNIQRDNNTFLVHLKLTLRPPGTYRTLIYAGATDLNG